MKNFDRNYIYIIILYAAVTVYYLLTEYVITGHRMGVPLDDTWIHFRYAENFIKGYFIEYNINEPTPGTTSPLWIIILSPAFLLRIDPVYFSLAAGSILFLFTCIEVYRVCLRLNFQKVTALFAALLTLLSGRLIWSSLSGMEITLLCFLILLVTRIHLNEIRNKKLRAVTGLLLGLACITRPEAVLFALIYYIVSFVLLKNEIMLNKKKILLSLVLFLIIVVPYPIFSYVHTQRFLPNTFNAQGGGLRFIPDMGFLIETGKLFFKDNLVILILWFISIGWFIYTVIKSISGTPPRKKFIEKKFLLINLWIILFPAISSVLEPNWRHHGRYLIPIIPFVTAASIHTAVKIYDYMQAKGLRLQFLRQGKIAFVIVVFLLTLISIVLYANLLGWNAENIDDQQVRIGNWLNQNLPEEEVFGLNDIGAIVYITKKRAVDMEGLITPEVFGFRRLNEKERNVRMLELLKRNKVNYLIIYPQWFSYLVEANSSALEKIYSARLERNTICGEDEMFVYRIHWDKIIDS